MNYWCAASVICAACNHSDMSANHISAHVAFISKGPMWTIDLWLVSCSFSTVVHSSHLSQCPSPIQAWRSPLCPEAWPLCPSPGPPGWDSPPCLLGSVSCWSATSTPRWVLHSVSLKPVSPSSSSSSSWSHPAGRLKAFNCFWLLDILMFDWFYKMWWFIKLLDLHTGALYFTYWWLYTPPPPPKV